MLVVNWLLPNGGTDRNSRIPCNCNSTYRLSIFVTEKLNDIKGVIRGRNSKGSWFVLVFYECLSVPLLVCVCFLWVSVVSTVGLFLFSMSVCRFHRWFVFAFYECLSVPLLVCFCFLWVSVDQRWNRQTLIENKHKPTVELTDTHRKQTQTNSGTDRHS
jgi:hypothetical protein